MTQFRFPNESDEYRRARNELLDSEVQLRDQIEAVSEQRRQLPNGGELKKNYTLERVTDRDSAQSVSFANLFGTHSSLIIYTMMFGPDWDAPCPSCTGIVDSINANALGVQQEAALAVVAAATPAQLAHWRDKRGWRWIDLLSDPENDYILDYAGFDTEDPSVVSCMNVFRKTDDGIYHFWASELLSRPMESGHPRHVDMIWPLWNLLDMTPDGRGEALIPRQDFEHRYFSENILTAFEK